MDRLVRVYEEFGQSPWLDNLMRRYLTDGTLAGLVAGGIRGLTSNPTIFQKAIQGSSDYDSQFAEILDAGASITDAYWELVTTDIVGACEAFAALHRDSQGRDGFVSVEVDPGLAYDGPRTEVAARALHQRLDRPNLMVKIPATREGIPAIQQMIAEGRSINVTLIFSLERYQRVMEAYLAGLEEYSRVDGADLSKVASVASFFISRVDTAVDAELERIGTSAALDLRGSAAVAQAKLAYRAFQQTFSGPRWDALAARGARVQRPLWASTSTKNPAYPDTLYVDELIGPLTVNTLPDATVTAFADHGTLARRIDADVERAESAWSALHALDIDMAEVSTRLEHEGVASFQESFMTLLDALVSKASTLSTRHTDGSAP